MANTYNNNRIPKPFGYDFKDRPEKTQDVNCVVVVNPGNFRYDKSGNPIGAYVNVQVDARDVKPDDPTGTLHLVLEKDPETKRRNNRAFYHYNQLNDIMEAAGDNVIEIPTSKGAVTVACVKTGKLNVTHNQRNAKRQQTSRTVMDTKNLSASDYRVHKDILTDQNNANKHFQTLRSEERLQQNSKQTFNTAKPQSSNVLNNLVNQGRAMKENVQESSNNNYYKQPSEQVEQVNNAGDINKNSLPSLDQKPNPVVSPVDEVYEQLTLDDVANDTNSATVLSDDMAGAYSSEELSAMDYENSQLDQQTLDAIKKAEEITEDFDLNDDFDGDYDGDSLGYIPF